MKEIGLLFSAPMARAMVRPVNPKTQTRRLPAAHNCLVDGHGMSAKRWAAMQFDWANAWVDGHDCIKVASLNPDNHGTVHRIYPRAEVGDVVWGRETWNWFDPTCIPAERAGPVAPVTGAQGNRKIPWLAAFAADGELPYPGHEGRSHWRPAIHMPRWVARIVRPIARMRFERLQDISRNDAISEGLVQHQGAESWWGTGLEGTGFNGCRFLSPIQAYRELWQHINGPTSWAANPIVLAYEFGAPTP